MMKNPVIESEIFTRAVTGILTREDLEAKLKRGKPLRIKFGVDITASALHIGNAVNLWKMRELQEYGHKVVFLIGDFTTKIGDPTGRTEARKPSVEKDVKIWAKKFIAQVGTILRTDKKVFEVRRNSEWYSRMSVEKLLSLMTLFTHARIMERDMFQNRIKNGKEILLPEIIYPILQGYDSVMLESDLTVVGSDQLFNENMGRFLQEKFGQAPQVLMTTAITPGLDGGPKMSKSLGNYIGLEDSPRDKFGKAMRLLDSLIIPYLEVYTDVPSAEIKIREADLKNGKNPMEVKLFFAEALVQRYHGEKIARAERERFLKIFSKRELTDIQEVTLPYGRNGILEILVMLGFSVSKNQARILIEQGAVDVDGKTLPEPVDIEIKKGTVIKVGKHRFVKIK